MAYVRFREGPGYDSDDAGRQDPSGERDLVIILHFVQVRDEEASHVKPKIVRVDARNHIASERSPLPTSADR